jgi:hypothetical protein
MASSNLQVRFSSGAFLGPLHIQNLHQPELIPAIPAVEFYCIHALTYEVEAQPPRPHIFERAPAQLFTIRRRTVIFEHDFKRIFALAISRRLNPVEGCLDGPPRVSEVGVANDICQRFVYGENHSAAFRLGKSHCCRELPQGLSHYAEHLRIAPQFHSE